MHKGTGRVREQLDGTVVVSLQEHNGVGATGGNPSQKRHNRLMQRTAAFI